jgi:NlpC/P60 family putative phage cell wall peptidase
MTREQVVTEARTWIGTPYLRRAHLKGIGCDCFTFLFEVYRACGIVSQPEVLEAERTILSDDWFQHTTEERYVKWALRHASKLVEEVSYKTLKAGPGDMVLIRAARSKVYNHGGIVTAWPHVIHCLTPAVVEINASTDPLWAYQVVAVFDPWAKAVAP